MRSSGRTDRFLGGLECSDRNVGRDILLKLFCIAGWIFMILFFINVLRTNLKMWFLLKFQGWLTMIFSLSFTSLLLKTHVSPLSWDFCRQAFDTVIQFAPFSVSSLKHTHTFISILNFVTKLFICTLWT